MKTEAYCCNFEPKRIGFMRWLFLLFYSLSSGIIVGQSGYPKGYFSNPLGHPIRLSGNFGELRPNHFHMGLDFRTGGRENLPVYAAADGYISRIKVEPAGFGQSLYIDHPNGFTTLYAHLNAFNPTIERWVKQEQYARSSWKQTLFPPDQLFPVKKGMLIGYSGNTGGSQAPHLHFEIRRTKDDVCLNPLYFGFPVQDHIAPKIQRLAVYDRTQSTYEQLPHIVTLKTGGVNAFTTINSVIEVGSSTVSLAIAAFDLQDGSTNQNGIAAVQLWMDGKLQSSFEMNEIGYDRTRYLNAHVDYSTRYRGGPWLQHLSVLPGYYQSIYGEGDGLLKLKAGVNHAIRIEVLDANGNKATVETMLRWNGALSSPFVQTGEGKRFNPLMLDVFESAQCEFFMGEKCLYDAAFIGYRLIASNGLELSAKHIIGNPAIPLQDSFMIRIRPTQKVSPAEQQHTLMQWVSGSKKAVQKVTWQNGWAAAKFRDFGSFQLILDTLPPTIVPIGFSDGADLRGAVRLMFTVKDQWEKFKNVEAYLDDRWLRFTNDKGKTFIYHFDEKCAPGDHTLRIEADDEAGNHTVQTFKFKR